MLETLLAWMLPRGPGVAPAGFPTKRRESTDSAIGIDNLWSYSSSEIDAASVVSWQGAHQPWKSRSAGRRFQNCRIMCSTHVPPPPTLDRPATGASRPPPPPGGAVIPVIPPVLPPPSVFSAASSVCDDDLARFRQVVCPIQFRIKDVFAELFDDDEKWHDECRMSWPIDHAAVLQAPLLSIHEPAPSFSSPRPHGMDQLPLSVFNNRLRCTDRLPIFSWNRGPRMGRGTWCAFKKAFSPLTGRSKKVSMS